MRRNRECPWDSFDSIAYFSHNYSILRYDDKALLTQVRDFFEFQRFGEKLRGIDVGTGSNLYPALLMLPWCSSITLLEFAQSNVEWLAKETKSYSVSWDDFWAVIAEHHNFEQITDPRRTLSSKVEIEQGNIFDLPHSEWDIGTMFFVAESITESVGEFQIATRSFLRCLRPGGCFAAAFMENSEGYDVGADRFPAVAISAADIGSVIERESSDVAVTRIGAGENALRNGYSGMLLALGHRDGS